MNTVAELNETLREQCCNGNVVGALKSLENGAEINSQNKVNAWTALHWAAKRGQKQIIELLLKQGADPSIRNGKGELPSDLTDKEDVKSLLEVCTGSSKENAASENNLSENSRSGTLSFVPGYLANPVFPYAVATGNPIFTKAATSTAPNVVNEPSVLVPGYIANPVLMATANPVIAANENQSAEDGKSDQQVLVPGYIANPMFPCAMATGTPMPDSANKQPKHDSVNFVPGYIMGANNSLITENKVPEEYKQIFVPHVQQLGSLVNTYVNSMKSLEKPVEYRLYNSCKTTPVATVFVSTPVNEIVLKMRVADTVENDFIEVELNSKLLTYDELLNVCSKELQINRSQISKIRKLPNTVVRRDKDVKRLQPYQELEVILN